MNCKGFFAFTLFVSIAFAAHIDIPGDINAIEVFTETEELNVPSGFAIISDNNEPRTGGTEDYYDQEQDYIPVDPEYYPENPDYPQEGTPDYYDDYYDNYYYDETSSDTNENM